MLVCPQCGVETPAPGGECPNCSGSGASSPTERGAFGAADPSENRTAQSGVRVREPEGASPEGPLKEGQQVGVRYRIERLLGSGGMGAVYRAWDKELRIPVALKVIRPTRGSETSSQSQDARFRRELLLARRVSHKNVVRIHDIGEIDGLKYITMTYVDGVTLASLLEQEGKLPVARSLSILRQIAAGLAEAHDADVVHRDLKPANVMVDRSDHAWVMDFGIARSTKTALPVEAVEGEAATAGRDAEDTPPEDDPLDYTQPGQIVGTYLYMAPEQASGSAVDGRADVYAMGLMLRQMLVGKRRGRFSSLGELLRNLKQPPTSLREDDPRVPEALDRIVLRCLQPDPEARYESAGELLEALNRLDDEGHALPEAKPLRGQALVAAVFLAVGLGVGGWWLSGIGEPPEPPAPVSILVADVENATGDPVFDGGALEQAFVLALEEAPFVAIYPRNDALRIAEEVSGVSGLDAERARLVSTREGVELVLTGRIDARGSGYELSARAVDPAAAAEDRAVVADARVSAASKAAVLPAIGELAVDIREALGDLDPDRGSTDAETFTASSLEAMNAYARAQAANYQGRTEEALDAYRESIRLDPRMGRAYNGIAAIYRDLGRPEEAEANFQKAVENLDRMTEREKLRTLGLYYLGVTRNYQKAVENYETLVELFPADNAAHANLALASLYVGDMERAMSEGRAAIEIYPNNVLQRTNYAMYAMYAGEFDTAIEQARRALEASPDYDYSQLVVSMATGAKGEAEAAREAYGALAGMSDYGASMSAIGTADLDVYEARYADALEILGESIERERTAEQDWLVAQNLILAAEAHFSLSNEAQAVALAQEAVALTGHESVLFPAARILVRAGRSAEAEAFVDRLKEQIQPQARSYAELIRAELARERGQYADALDSLRRALEWNDSWWGRFLRGVSYLEAGFPAEALSELELCLKRRGEVADVFLIDTPSLRYLPSVHYWLGRAQEALGTTLAARASFESYLRIRSAATRDRLAEDASRRLEALTSSGSSTPSPGRFAASSH